LDLRYSESAFGIPQKKRSGNPDCQIIRPGTVKPLSGGPLQPDSPMPPGAALERGQRWRGYCFDKAYMSTKVLFIF
jgi:hypothetical protein